MAWRAAGCFGAAVALLASAAAPVSGEPVLYDTVAPLPPDTPLEILAKRDGWSAASGGALRGDAWLENAALAAWIRRTDGRLVLFYRLGGAFRRCAEAAIAASEDDPAAAFSSLTPGGGPGVSLSALGETVSGKPAALRLRLVGDQPRLECVPGPGSACLRLDVRAAHAVLPDVFGDDVVFRAGEGEEGAVRCLPGECALMLPVGGGDALLTCAWPPAPKDVLLRARDGSFDRVILPGAESETLALAVPAAPGIWHETDAARFSIFEYTRMDWVPPFPARYRCDLRREGPWGLTDAWRRATSPNRVWYSFLNYCFPPLYLAADGAFLRIPRFRASGRDALSQAKELRFAGPILIYPFDRETEARAGRTPDDAWTLLDVLRAGPGALQALDIGEGVLQDTPHPKGFVYVATCGATGVVEKLFARNKERDQADTIRQQFDGMRQFVRYNRARLEAYLAFASACRKALEEVRAICPNLPELERALGDLLPLLDYFPAQFEENRETIKTPEHCEGLSARIVALIESEDPGKAEQVKQLGKAIREIGGCQDDLLGAFRLHAKALRQRAAQLHAAAADPAVRGAMRLVRRHTQALLRIRSPYEGH